MPSSESALNLLPVELLLIIIGILPLPSLLSLSRVNKAFHSLCQDNAIWNEKLLSFSYEEAEQNSNGNQLVPNSSYQRFKFYYTQPYYIDKKKISKNVDHTLWIFCDRLYRGVKTGDMVMLKELLKEVKEKRNKSVRKMQKGENLWKAIEIPAGNISLEDLLKSNIRDSKRKNPWHYAIHHPVTSRSVFTDTISKWEFLYCASFFWPEAFQKPENNKISVYPLLSKAITYNQLAIVSALFDDFIIDINTKLDSYQKQFILFAACENGHVELVKYLLGKDFTIIDNGGFLHIAAYNGYLDVVRLLVENSANTQEVHRFCDGIRTPLQAAAAGGHLGIVRFLLETGVDINQESTADDAKSTALYFAAVEGHFIVVKYLLEEGVESAAISDIEVVENEGHKEIGVLLREHRLIREKEKVLQKVLEERNLLDSSILEKGKVLYAWYVNQNILNGYWFNYKPEAARISNVLSSKLLAKQNFTLADFKQVVNNSFLDPKSTFNFWKKSKDYDSVDSADYFKVISEFIERLLKNEKKCSLLQSKIGSPSL